MKKVLIIFSILIFNWQIFANDRITFEERKDILEENGLVQISSDFIEGGEVFFYTSPFFLNEEVGGNTLFSVIALFENRDPEIGLLSLLAKKEKESVYMCSSRKGTCFKKALTEELDGGLIIAFLIEGIISTTGLELISKQDLNTVYKVSDKNRYVILDILQVFYELFDKEELEKSRESSWFYLEVDLEEVNKKFFLDHIRNRK